MRRGEIFPLAELTFLDSSALRERESLRPGIFLETTQWLEKREAGSSLLIHPLSSPSACCGGRKKDRRSGLEDSVVMGRGGGWVVPLADSSHRRRKVAKELGEILLLVLGSKGFAG